MLCDARLAAVHFRQGCAIELHQLPVDVIKVVFDAAVGGVQQLQVEHAEHAGRGEVNEVPGAGEEQRHVVGAQVVARAVEVERGQRALAAVGAYRR